MTEVEFRAAGEADVEAVVALVESAYRGPSSATGWTTEAHLLDGRRTDAAQVRALLGRPASVVILAEMPAIDGSGPAIVGCCHVAARADGAASFGLFAVSPTRQGAGLGRALIG